MIGPILMDDAAFAPSNSNGDNDGWQGRQRRQRSLRLLMLFLMMLILLDGGDQEKGASSGSNSKKALRKQEKPVKGMGVELFEARRMLDSRIYRVAVSHDARFERIKKWNGGRDEEKEIEEWVSANRGQEEEDETQRLVYHYPRNSTGYYRGDWKRTKHALPWTEHSVGVHLLPETTSATEATENNRDQLPLTEESGRAALQLYSRFIPAMTQLSLVDGFVKLYDGSGTGWSTRRDILLRVRGVAIHALGRISLVASAPDGRSALVLADDAKSSEAVQKTKGNKQTEASDFSAVEEVANEEYPSEEVNKNKSRRLQETVSDLIALTVGTEDDITDNSSTKKEDLLDLIRDDALSLFADQWNANKVGGPGWTEHLTSGDQDMESVRRMETLDETTDTDQVNEFFFGEMIRNKAEQHSWDTTTLNGKESALWTQTSNPKLPWWKSLINTRRSLRSNNEAMEYSFSDLVSNAMNEFQDASEGHDSLNLNHNYEEEWTQSNSNRTFTADSELSATGTKNKNLPRSEEEEADYLESFATKKLFTFPYVPDDADRTLSNPPSTLTRQIPLREQVLENNAARCAFEVNFDVKEVQWTVGEWRKMVDFQIRSIQDLDPRVPKSADEADTHGSNTERSSLRPAPTNAVPSRDEALVMNLLGTITSANCNFSSAVNVTAIRTNWDHTTGKAINYSFYMMLTCLTQIVVLLRQLLHTQAQSAASRVSLICIGWQAVLDAILCIGHILLCLIMQPLFTAFASVAFFKLLIFCVIEMKYMAIIMQARTNATNNNRNTNNNAESLRRQIALLHLRFYGSLIFALVAFWYVGQKYLTFYVIVLYSFWIPQIVQNIVTEAKKPLHAYYIYGMSVTRLVAPLYVFALPNNFLKEIYPDFPTNLVMCEFLFLWVGLQTVVLIAQGRYGARFMIPARFLPPKFNYSRPVPSSLLPTPTLNIEQQPVLLNDIESAPLLIADDNSPSPAGESRTGPRNRRKENRTRPNTIVSSRVEETPTTEHAEIGSSSSNTLDCVICYNAIDVNNRRGYMLAPCDHIFHRDCLVQWMEVKMECPICRTELPAL